ncbi:MAG: glyoxylate/hydroxypyruvate reductase A [Magnetovibrio sp.]|nr:glyoxylate/hydroxypyruvate reductase A [Magnetovibrio sp.]
MKILYISTVPVTAWRKAIRLLIPQADLFVWGEDPVVADEVDYILAWNPAPGVLAQFPNAKAIFNLGAGVDRLLQDSNLPKNIPIVRLVDPLLSSGMTEHMMYWVLHFHRNMHVYCQQKTAARWVQHTPHNTQKRPIGILGLGELGQDVAHALLMMGFENLAGWSLSRKDLPGIESFAGADALEAFLGRTEILLCLLPHTPMTQGLLQANTLAKLPQGAFIINAGRGGLIVENDLIAALTSGHIEAAALDVFKTEPLPEDHAFWTMDNVFITPHVASITYPSSATQVIANGIDAVEHGEPPDNVVDLASGY